MESIGVGAVLGAIGFWGFVAIVVVAGIWNGIRKREAQHETLRRMVDSGRAIDPGLMNKLLSASENGSGENLGRDLKISGLIVIFIAPGLAVMGWFLAQLSEDALMPLLGASVLVGFVGIGLLVAAKVAEREYQMDDVSRPNQPEA